MISARPHKTKSNILSDTALFRQSIITTSNNNRFLLGNTVGSLENFSVTPQGPMPATLLNHDGTWLGRTHFNLDTLRLVLENMRKKDDVMSDEFCKLIVLKLSGGKQLAPAVEEKLAECPDVRFLVWSSELIIPDGPYMVLGTALRQVLKVYGDPYGAFACGIRPEGSNPERYQQISSGGFIAVPSRHYYPERSPKQPLSGIRVAVKEIYDINGITTTGGSRSYALLQDPAAKTAPCIQALIDKGAVIVGLTKTVQFASGMAASDWRESVCPINPRGDRNLDPDCSSTGSAVAVAAYPWLDAAIGSDSLGSMIGPAAACGIYGMRPSHGILSNNGAIPVSSALDTPGHYARSASLLANIGNAWCLETIQPSVRSLLNKQGSPRVVLPLHGLFTTGPTSNVVGKAIGSLGEQLKLKVEHIDIERLWQRAWGRHPEQKSIADYLSKTIAIIQLHDADRNGSTWRIKYSEKYGSRPPVDPLIKFKWNLGSGITDEQYQQALEEKQVITDFLAAYVLTPETIMILPGSSPEPHFRDRTSRTPLKERGMLWQGFGFSSTTLPLLAGLPCVSVPGSDIQLLSIVEQLKFLNKTAQVKASKSMVYQTVETKATGPMRKLTQKGRRWHVYTPGESGLRKLQEKKTRK